MSKAFTKEDSDGAPEPLPDREISPHRNLVTADGLAAIEQTVAALEREEAAALAAGDRDRSAAIARDLRYWSARRGSAEVMPEPPDASRVHFGSRVTIERADGRRQTWRITGEDEADPKRGTISYVSPLASALLGRSVGDEVAAGPTSAEIVAII